jgi:type I restriction enzyme S subunit
LNSGVFVVRPTNEDYLTNYFFWALRSSLFFEFIKYHSKGSTINHLYQDTFQNLPFLLPSVKEQTVIADYLDRKTAQIDNLIAKKQRLVDLLNEEKAVVINQAVTKGLDSNSPMKDSGIPSLGEIPAHWHMKKIKHVLLRKRTALKTGPFGSQLKTTDFVLNGGYKVYNQRNVLDDDFDLGDDFIDDQKFSELKEFEIFPGDILITTRGTIGKCAIFPSKKRDGVLHPCLIRIQVDEGIVLKDWITNYINNSSLFLSAVLLESNATTIDVIYGTDLKEIFIPVPNDLREQRDVLEYINNQLLRIRETTRKINKEIELLQEYRTVLISEAVTGKIDIRGVNANDALCRMGT